MIITCDECNSSFSVNDSVIKEAGSKVRCSKCNSVFVVYPQQTENIDELETAGVDMALDSDEHITAEEDIGLDDLDSSFDDFLTDDEEDETTAVSSETDDSELDLADFDEDLGAGIGLESDDELEATSGELELDLDFDQDDDADLELNEGAVAGDELPDLSGLEELAELDEDDSELEDFSLELEPEAEAGLELEGDDGFDSANLEIEESDELDLSDLELAIDDDTAPEGTADAAPEELSLDLETENQAAEENAASGLDVEEADALDISDLDLAMEDAPLAEEASDAAAEDLDLDLELDLEAETIAAGTDPETVSSDTDADELDLSDLTDILEDEKAQEAVSQPEELDMELDLAADASKEVDELAAGADSGGGDELDVSDLASIVDSESAPAAQPAAESASEDLEMDLDFQIDDDVQSADAAADAENEDELDFSDLEQMLESDETPTVEAAGDKEAEELDLQFDIDGPSAGDENMAAADEISAEERDDDFLDIEQMLEEGDDGSPSQATELAGEVTDLPLEMEAALDDASKGADAELELDFDLESELQKNGDIFDGSETPDQQLESNLLASDEVDFLEEAGIEEAEFQDGSGTSEIITDDFASDGFTDTNDAYGATQALPDSDNEPLEEEAFDAEPMAEGPKPKKVRSKKPVLVTLVLFLLAAGVFIVPNMLGFKIPYISDIKIPYLSDLDLKIPYLSDWLNPEEQDVAGNLKIIPLGNTINGKFVNNSQAGQLFVIRGKIKNDYDHPRSYIKVTGKLYQKGAQVAKQATVYCGNMLSQSDLTAMDMASINKQLLKKSGNKRSNFKVKTGKMVPFMIVFDKLPRNLDEYTVEVEGSSI